MNQVDNPTQRNHKPMFNTIEPSIVRTQFASINTDASFSSYLQPDHHRQQRAEESDQIGIFDAAKYFKGSLDEQKEQTASPRVARLSSSSSCTDPGNNYRARSFHGAPTASSEVSWTSQTGLLQQPNPSSLMVKQNQTPSTNTTTRWSPKWLICPCSGKKSVRVEDKTTPRMVDLGTNYPPSFYSARQNSPKISPTNGNFNSVPKKFDYTTTTTTTTIAAKNPVGFSCPSGNNNPNGFLAFSSNNPKVNVSTTAITTTTTTTLCGTSAPTTNGFTFPILENPPAGVKKMFNVIAPNLDPHRDSLEVYQPKSPKSRRTSYEEETTLSDASSDLFEIDSFSTPNFNINNNVKRMGGPVWRRSLDEETINEGDDVESMALTEGYAPTEFSVDWSVTTAEGFDRGSLANFSVSASEVGYVRRETENNNDKRNKGSSVISGGNNGGGLLMSCRCEKAVSVGPGPKKCVGSGESAGPRNPGRQVGGRGKEEGKGGHGMVVSGATTGNNYSNKHGAGRSRSFAT